jgi:retron-type reverse transcriptase
MPISQNPSPDRKKRSFGPPKETPIADQLLKDLTNRQYPDIRAMYDICPNEGLVTYNERGVPSLSEYHTCKYVHKNVFPIIYHPEVLERAYYKARKTKGAYTPGSDPSDSLDGWSTETILQLSTSLKSNTFRFSPVREKLIPRKGKTPRPLGVPNGSDKVVYLAILFVLEAIYEPEFEVGNFNYGFRTKHSCHEAIHKLTTKLPQSKREAKARTDQQTRGYNFVIEGDIEQAYPSVDHKIFLKLLSRRIQDKRFHALMKDLLHAGYMDEQKVVHHPVTGVPQGSGVSPMIWNIYFYHFDVYVMTEIHSLVARCRRKFLSSPEKWKCLHMDSHRKKNAEYRKLAEYERKKEKIKISEIRQSLQNCSPDQLSKHGASLKNDLRLSRKTHIKSQAISKTLPSSRIPAEAKLQFVYVRYADDWVIAMTGPLALAKYIKMKITAWLMSELKLKLSQSKTRIVDPRRKPYIFLGFSIAQYRTSRFKWVEHNSVWRLRPSRPRATTVRIPFNEKIYPRLFEKGLIRYNPNTNPPTVKPREVPFWSTMPTYDIIRQFKWVFDGYYNYYASFARQHELVWLYYLCTYACYKTLAQKYRTSVTEMRTKFERKNLASFYLEEPYKEGAPPKVIVWKAFTLYSPPLLKDNEVRDPWRILNNFRTKYHMNLPCLFCYATPAEMHHTRELLSRGNDKPFAWREKAMNAKQVPLCRSCHSQLGRIPNYQQKVGNCWKIYNIENPPHDEISTILGEHKPW